MSARCCAPFKWPRLSVDDLTTPSCARVPPLALAVLRSVIVVYLFAVHVAQWAEYASEGGSNGRAYRFFTVVTYLLLLVVFAALAALSWQRAPWRDWRGGGAAGERTARPAPPPRWLVRGVWLAYEAVLTASMFLDIVFWALLARLLPDATNFSSINQHAVNVILLAAEMASNRISLIPAHLVVIFAYPAAYMAFAWIWFSTGNEVDADGNPRHIYPFLDVTGSPGTVTAFYLGIPLFFAFVFFVLFLIDRWCKRAWVCKYELGGVDTTRGWDGFSERHDVPLDDRDALDEK